MQDEHGLDPVALEAAVTAAKRAQEGWRNEERLDTLPGRGNPTIAAITAYLAALPSDTLNNERAIIATEALRYASHYPHGSDGRNTFVMLADWIQVRMGEKPLVSEPSQS